MGFFFSPHPPCKVKKKEKIPLQAYKTNFPPFRGKKKSNSPQKNTCPPNDFRLQNFFIGGIFFFFFLHKIFGFCRPTERKWIKKKKKVKGKNSPAPNWRKPAGYIKIKKNPKKKNFSIFPFIPFIKIKSTPPL